MSNQNQSKPGTALGGWLSGLAQATTPSYGALGVQNVPGGLVPTNTSTTNNSVTWGPGSVQSTNWPYPTPLAPGIESVPVITPSYPDKLHFRDSQGNIHSFDTAEVYRLLGLQW